MKLRFTLIVLLFIGIDACAQYPYINHMDWMKAQFNPAALGINNSENLLLNYNRSWISQEVNSNLAILQYDRAFISKKSKNIGGIGASISNNKVNYKDVLNRFHAALGAAYAVRVGREGYLNFGLQGGYYADHVSNTGLTTGSQYVPGVGFDPGIGNHEPGMNLKTDYIGISTGLFLYQASEGILPDNYFGLSIKNLNRPVNSLFESNSRLSPQFNLTGGLKLLESMKYKLVAECLYTNTNQKGNVTVGGVYEIKNLAISGFNANDASVRLISRYSINNKFLVGGQILYEQYVLGFTYDIKTKVTERSYESGFEVLIGFKRKLKRKERKSKPMEPIQKEILSATYIEPLQEPDTAEIVIGQVQESAIDSIETTEQKKGVATVGAIMVEPPIANSIYFDFASNEIMDNSMQHLRELVVEFYKGEKNIIVITGYTDNIGNESYNQNLSMKRANAVKVKLMEFGIDPDQIKVEWKGEEYPLYPNDSEANRSKNRRVEITLF